MNEPIISIRNVYKRFGNLVAVDNVSIEIMQNEFYALLGPSGCGKTTLLRMIAGFSTPSEGQILIDGQDMAQVPPNKRPVNMVFQSYAVFPHLSVERNVGYGLEVTGTPKSETLRLAHEALEKVGLSDFKTRMPDQLSGGQRQRVALARALVKRPKVLLLDEPLSALDAKLREQMQMELCSLQEDVGVTFIIVTHDQDEALSMADRIAVMRDGATAQIATPGTLYESPINRFVADFIGKVNIIEGQICGAKDDKVLVSTKLSGQVAIPFSGTAKGKVWLAVRPEKIAISNTKNTANGQIRTSGEIVDWAYYGDNSHMIVATSSGEKIGVVIQNSNRDSVDSLAIGDAVHLAWSPDDTMLLQE